MSGSQPQRALTVKVVSCREYGIEGKGRDSKKARLRRLCGGNTFDFERGEIPQNDGGKYLRPS